MFSSDDMPPPPQQSSLSSLLSQQLLSSSTSQSHQISSQISDSQISIGPTTHARLYGYSSTNAGLTALSEIPHSNVIFNNNEFGSSNNDAQVFSSNSQSQGTSSQSHISCSYSQQNSLFSLDSNMDKQSDLSKEDLDSKSGHSLLQPSISPPTPSHILLQKMPQFHSAFNFICNVKFPTNIQLLIDGEYTKSDILSSNYNLNNDSASINEAKNYDLLPQTLKSPQSLSSSTNKPSLQDAMIIASSAKQKKQFSSRIISQKTHSYHVSHHDGTELITETVVTHLHPLKHQQKYKKHEFQLLAVKNFLDNQKHFLYQNENNRSQMLDSIPLYLLPSIQFLLSQQEGQQYDNQTKENTNNNSIPNQISISGNVNNSNNIDDVIAAENYNRNNDNRNNDLSALFDDDFVSSRLNMLKTLLPSRSLSSSDDENDNIHKNNDDVNLNNDFSNKYHAVLINDEINSSKPQPAALLQSIASISPTSSLYLIYTYKPDFSMYFSLLSESIKSLSNINTPPPIFHRLIPAPIPLSSFPSYFPHIRLLSIEETDNIKLIRKQSIKIATHVKTKKFNELIQLFTEHCHTDYDITAQHIAEMLLKQQQKQKPKQIKTKSTVKISSPLLKKHQSEEQHSPSLSSMQPISDSFNEYSKFFSDIMLSLHSATRFVSIPYVIELTTIPYYSLSDNEEILSTASKYTIISPTTIRINIKGCHCKKGVCNTMKCLCYQVGAQCGTHCHCNNNACNNDYINYNLDIFGGYLFYYKTNEKLSQIQLQESSLMQSIPKSECYILHEFPSQTTLTHIRDKTTRILKKIFHKQVLNLQKYASHMFFYLSLFLTKQSTNISQKQSYPVQVSSHSRPVSTSSTSSSSSSSPPSSPPYIPSFFSQPSLNRSDLQEDTFARIAGNWFTSRTDLVSSHGLINFNYFGNNISNNTSGNNHDDCNTPNFINQNQCSSNYNSQTNSSINLPIYNQNSSVMITPTSYFPSFYQPNLSQNSKIISNNQNSLINVSNTGNNNDYVIYSDKINNNIVENNSTNNNSSINNNDDSNNIHNDKIINKTIEEIHYPLIRRKKKLKSVSFNDDITLHPPISLKSNVSVDCIKTDYQIINHCLNTNSDDDNVYHPPVKRKNK